MTMKRILFTIWFQLEARKKNTYFLDCKRERRMLQMIYDSLFECGPRAC